MLLEYLIGFMTAIISAGGYAGVFVLMALESMIAPVPSEAVMPFAGFLVAQGKLSIYFAIIAAALGSIVGSIVSYYLGLYGGREAVLKYGKYLLLNEHHLDWTENWFKKHGEKTILASRFVPVVRHLISIPAGIGKMDKRRFLAYTLVGATTWNTFLLYVGIYLNEKWRLLSQYSEKLDIVVAAIIGIAIALYLRKAYRKYRSD